MKLSKFIILFYSVLNYATCFILEGSQNSYVKYPKWYHSFEDEISFEFKTKQSDGLVLYTDDGGISNFYEMSIHDGIFRVSFKIGSANHKRAHRVTHIEINKTVSDNRWHKIKFFQFWENVQLNVDNNRASIKLSQRDFRFGSYETNSEIHVGGLPDDIPDKELSSPLAKHLRHLAASFRNFIYRTLPQGVTAPHILEMQGSRITDDDFCKNVEEYCHNGGICYSTNSGPKCNCQYVNFRGKKCNKPDPSPLEVSFYGNEYVSYDFVSSQNGFTYKEEKLQIGFRTKQANALIFYAGEQQDYLHITLTDGAVVVTSTVGGAKRTLKVFPFSTNQENKAYNDDRWHALILHRRLNTISISVDGLHSDVKQTISDDYSFLTNSFAYVGGRPHVDSLMNVDASVPNFVGCMRKIHYRADGRRLDLLQLAKRGSASMVSPHGNLAFECRPVANSEPISLLHSDAFIKIPSWHAAKSGTLSFAFRTNEADGLLLFNTATGGNSSSDFLAFELINRDLFFAMNLGSGTVRLHTKTLNSLTDGMHWHKVTLIREGQSGKVIVDDVTYDFATPGSANQLDLGGNLYIGGWDWSHPTSLSAMPSAVWSAGLRKGFVGCITQLNLNGVSTDLLTAASNSKSADIRIGCQTSVPQCPSNPCMNDAKCTEGWNKYTCDCSTTPMIGSQCNQEPLTIQFVETGQHMHVSLPFTLQSEAENLKLKFRSRKGWGILVATSCRFCPDRYELSLINGQLEFLLTIGDAIHNWVFGNDLADNSWHNVEISRRGHTLFVSVDGSKPVRHKVPKSQLAIRYDTFWAGRVSGSSTKIGHNRNARMLGARPSANAAPDIGLSFIGEMAAFEFNGLGIFDLAAREKSGDVIFSSGVNITAQFGAHRTVQENPITFTSRSAYAVLGDDLFKNAPLLHIFFQFRTLEPNGLLLYSEGLDRDFIAIELTNGKLVYTFNSGEGSKRIEANTGYSLNNFKWHFILVYQKTAEEHLVVVDNVTAHLKVNGNNHQLNLRGALYIGGVEQHAYSMLPPQIKSRHGFRGCVATVEISQNRFDLLNDIQRQEGLEKGCQGPLVLCHAESCANGGICLQQWNGYKCDCEMTSYEGKTCDQKSMTYLFGQQEPGMIVYTMTDRPNTESDLLVLGIETHHSPAILVRVESNSPDDFLMLGINGDGHAVVVYNLGTEDHVIGDVSKRVDDGKYHVIRFTRIEQNSTFQLDDLPKLNKRPKGRQLKTLNSQSRILIGGQIQANTNEVDYSNFEKRLTKRHTDKRIERPFKGKLTGFNFNGLKVLDLAYTNSQKVKVIGGVKPMVDKRHPSNNMPDSSDIGRSVIGEREVGEPSGLDPRLAKFKQYQTTGLTSRMMSSSSSSMSPDNDDLLASGYDEGSGGCSEDDVDSDDECMVDDPSATDLITPSFVRSTPKPRRIGPTTVRPIPPPNESYEVDIDYISPMVASGEPPEIDDYFPIKIENSNAKEIENLPGQVGNGYNPFKKPEPKPTRPKGFQIPPARYPSKSESRVITNPRPNFPFTKHVITSPAPEQILDEIGAAKPDPDSRILIKGNAVVTKEVIEVKGENGETSIIEENLPHGERVDARVNGGNRVDARVEQNNNPFVTQPVENTFPALIDPGFDAPPAPRPTLPSKNSNNLDPASQPSEEEDEEEHFPRTGLIAGVSISLIVIIIVIVFLVFKCYNRTKQPDTFSVDSAGVQTTVTAANIAAQKGQYQTFYNDSPSPPTNPLITTRVTQVNGVGSMKGKKKKDFKEWYV